MPRSSKDTAKGKLSPTQKTENSEKIKPGSVMTREPKKPNGRDTDPQHNEPKNEVEKYDLERAEVEERAKKRIRDQWRKGSGQDRPRRHFTPWLLLRYSHTDMGLRPIPPQQNFWCSPDIWVESQDPAGHPVAGKENFVHARIFNLGMSGAAPVKVDFYWADPSAGLGPANMNLIGTEWVEVKSLNAPDIRCNTPWIPSMSYGEHQCLMVNCSNHIADPIIYPFQPTLDRHVGQRNVQVIAAPPGSMFKFQIFVNNLFPIQLNAMMTMRMEHLRLSDEAMKQKLSIQEIENLMLGFGAENPQAREIRERYISRRTEFYQAAGVGKLMAKKATRQQPPLVERISARFGMPTVESKMTGHSKIFEPKNRGDLMGQWLLAMDKFRETKFQEIPNSFRLLEAPLKPFEQRQLAVEAELPREAKPGEYFVFHVHQQWEHGVLGGYTVLVSVK